MHYTKSQCITCCKIHLRANAPVEPANVWGVPAVGVDPAGHQHVALGLLILDNVVEVRAGSQHGGLAQALSAQHHQQPQQTDPALLLQLCGGRKK